MLRSPSISGPKIEDYHDNLLIPALKEEELFHSPLCSETFPDDFMSKNAQTILSQSGLLSPKICLTDTICEPIKHTASMFVYMTFVKIINRECLDKIIFVK